VPNGEKIAVSLLGTKNNCDH